MTAAAWDATVARMTADGTPATTVVVADDDAGFREAVAALLAVEDDFVVVGQAGDGPAALALAAATGARLVLVDVRMPGGGPLLVRALSRGPQAPVVVGLSANEDATTWIDLIRAGADGYLLKGALGADLPSLLRRCCAGELIVTAPRAAHVIRRYLDGI